MTCGYAQQVVRLDVVKLVVVACWFRDVSWAGPTVAAHTLSMTRFPHTQDNAYPFSDRPALLVFASQAA